MKHRAITDPILCMTLTLGVGDDAALARISWNKGSCHVKAADLSLGRWTRVEFPGCPEQTPPVDVVCRATALAVGAMLKDDLQSTLARLP